MTPRFLYRTGHRSLMASFFLLLILQLATSVLSWRPEWSPNDQLELSELDGRKLFVGEEVSSDNFKLLHTEDDWMLVGARNKVHNLSMVTLHEFSRLEWEPRAIDIQMCISKQKSQDECQNYINVLGKKSNNELYVCGTNAFKPKCRVYKHQVRNKGMEYKHSSEESGVGKSPYDPQLNSTAVYADGKLYSATAADFSGKDPLILEASQMIRTEQHDSKWLNEPNFVNSFNIGDKVYFFFRETAIENINCGKAVFSRVARVCKQDMGGGKMILKKLWTSFFKARLNCSIPGDFPFYFDEIQSTSQFGEGNFMSTPSSANRSSMVYAVFNTPENSIAGSAVCAFRFSDIVDVFQGKFKGQKSANENWLSVPSLDTPTPHPEECVNDSRKVHESTLDFIKLHPLMDRAIGAAGNAPLLVRTSFRSQFTQITVDYQIHAADNRYYDVLFVGTNDGKVIKSINKGRGSDIETVVIEETKVFHNKQPIVNMKIFRDKGLEKLIVISKDNILSIPLHRCHEKRSCAECVALQDPYCSWVDDQCAASDRGIQNIPEGHADACGDFTTHGKMEVVTEKERTTTPTIQQTSPKTTCPPCERCSCSDKTLEKNSTNDLPNVIEPNPTPTERKPENEGNINDNTINGPRYQEFTEEITLFEAQTLAIAIVVSIVLSTVAGFLIGYKVSMCRQENTNNYRNSLTYDPSLGSLKRKQKTIDEDHYVNSDSPLSPFSKNQLNYCVNIAPKNSKLPNGSAEVTKASTNNTNKTYV
ncbi:hypothetical protein ScPMuIL_017754 [Solemya velum]